MILLLHSPFLGLQKRSSADYILSALFEHSHCLRCHSYSAEDSTRSDCYDWSKRVVRAVTRGACSWSECYIEKTMIQNCYSRSQWTASSKTSADVLWRRVPLRLFLPLVYLLLLLLFSLFLLPSLSSLPPLKTFPISISSHRHFSQRNFRKQCTRAKVP